MHGKRNRINRFLKYFIIFDNMYKAILIISIGFLLGLSGSTFAQCDNSLIGKCVGSGENLKYIKHFKIRFAESPNIKKRSEGNFTVMLMKGNHYRFFACNDDSKVGKTIIELSNDFSQFGGNYNAETNTEYRAFDFVCTKTGPYYLKMFFKDGKEGCGVGIISLVME